MLNGLAVLLLYAALANGPVALVAPFVATYPLVTIVGSMLLHGKIEGGDGLQSEWRSPCWAWCCCLRAT